jgi:transcriptional regulator with XRE-family HTH domain
MGLMHWYHYVMAEKTTRDWMGDLGRQLRAIRLARGWDQAELAERASVARPVISRLENGSGTAVSSLVKVVVALDATEWLQVLAPATDGPSPLELLRQERRRRQPRVRMRQRRGV